MVFGQLDIHFGGKNLDIWWVKWFECKKILGNH